MPVAHGKRKLAENRLIGLAEDGVRQTMDDFITLSLNSLSVCLSLDLC